MPNMANCKILRTVMPGAAAIALILVIWGAHYRKHSPNPSADEAWEKYSDAAYGALDADHYVEAERAARSALAKSRRVAVFDDRRAESLNLVGRACSGQRKYEDAEAFYRQAIAEYRRSPSVDERHVADVLTNLGDDYRLQGRIDDAIRVSKEVHSLDDARVAPNDIERVRHLELEVLLRMHLKRYAEARALQERISGIRRANGVQDKGSEGADLKVIGMTYSYEGNYAKAETVFGQAIPMLISADGADAPGVARALRGLANVLNHEGKLAKAEPLYLRAIGIFERSLGPGSPSLGGVMSDYAILLKKMHRDKEAAAFRAKAKAIPAKHSMDP